ncbi:MAG: M1 family aminopeptidase, partial [Bacteroidota bacterium]
MKQWTIVIIAFLSFTIPAGAQLQHGRATTHEKTFRQLEIERYKSLFQRSAAHVTSGQNIDVTYYNLALRITTSPQYLRGDVTMKAFSRQNGVNQVTLDLMQSMTIDSVKVGGSLTGFSQHPSSFDVTLDRSYNAGELMAVEIFYEGEPGSSGFGSFAFSSHGSVPWVWSLSEPYGAKDWWPCKDHPSDKADSADIIVTCDSTYRVGSNGILVSVTNNGDGTKTHHWQERYPISNYLISVALTNYAQFSNWFKYSPTDSMEVLNYALPVDLTSAMSGAPAAVEGLQIFSRLFGLYPFVKEKYGHSQFGWGGAMEHQTMTSTCCFDEDILIHELSHQWFGDMITCRTWPNIWLNEGFATYCEALFAEQKYGTGTYWNFLNNDMSSARLAAGTLYVSDSSNVGKLFDGSLVYDKGAVVLHMLRHVLGDSVFFKAMRNYANTASLMYSTASTPDFQAVCESTSTKDLSYFFNEWVYGEKYPRYGYDWTSSPSPQGYTVTYGVGQTTGTSNPAFFSMPIDLKIIGTGWDTTVTVFNDSLCQTFVFDVSHNPTLIQLDPEGWILKDTISVLSITPGFLDFGEVEMGWSKTDSVAMTNGRISKTLTVSSASSTLSDFTVSPESASIAPLATQEF